MKLVNVLQQKVDAAAPNTGISIGRWNDKATWRIDFKDQATKEQRAAAQAAIDAFDMEAEQQILDTKEALEEIDALLKLRGIREGFRGLFEWMDYLRNIPEGLDAAGVVAYLRALPPAGQGAAKLVQVDDMAIAERKKLAPK